MKVLTAIPVYNEERHVEGVLDEVRRFSPNILVINDGSVLPGCPQRVGGAHEQVSLGNWATREQQGVANRLAGSAESRSAAAITRR